MIYLIVIETHPEHIIDLRLDKPFPELLDFAKSLNFEEMDSMTFGHVPYSLILLKSLLNWKENHNDVLPSTYAEKQAFKKHLAEYKNLFPQSDLENIDEAIASAYRAWTPTEVPLSILNIMNDPQVEQMSSQVSTFIKKNSVF